MLENLFCSSVFRSVDCFFGYANSLLELPFACAGVIEIRSPQDAKTDLFEHIFIILHKLFKRISAKPGMGRETYRARIITTRTALALKSEGYQCFDPHVHSSYSYDVANVSETKPAYIVEHERDMGMIPIITDHDTMDGYAALKSKRLHDGVIPAVEIRIKPQKCKYGAGLGEIHTLHVNVFGLNTQQFRILEKIAHEKDLDAFIDYLRSEKLHYLYNHPFWHEHHERLNWKAVPLLARHYFDVLEINAGRSFALNNVTMYIAEQLQKGVVASTDTHTGNPGKAFVIAQGKDFDECWEHIKSRKMFIVRKDLTPAFVAGETSRVISQVFSANARQMKAKQYQMDSHLPLFDNLAKKVSYGSWKDRHAFKMVIKTILKGCNYSLGPMLAWYFYTKKDNKFGEHITHPIKKIVRHAKNQDSL